MTARSWSFPVLALGLMMLALGGQGLAAQGEHHQPQRQYRKTPRTRRH